MPLFFVTFSLILKLRLSTCAPVDSYYLFSMIKNLSTPINCIERLEIDAIETRRRNKKYSLLWYICKEIAKVDFLKCARCTALNIFWASKTSYVHMMMVDGVKNMEGMTSDKANKLNENLENQLIMWNPLVCWIAIIVMMMLLVLMLLCCYIMCAICV